MSELPRSTGSAIAGRVLTTAIAVATVLGLGTGRATVDGEEEVAQRTEDPYEAYQAGNYETALRGFVDRQVARPEDPDLQLNLGSTYYHLERYQDARSEFERAAGSDERRRRAEALYNLGNTAYRQGRLEEAIERYRGSLEIIPDDEDAKYNLEFVQRELERRRQQQQKEQEQENQEQQEDEQGQQEQQQQPQEQPPPETRDSDGDGLNDQTETSGANPTDPTNPDTDGDGRPDGEEDRNRNGALDPGETDPNRPDAPGEQPGDAAPQEASGELTEEEAARFLQGLEERRPDEPPKKAAVRKKGDKDW